MKPTKGTIKIFIAAVVFLAFILWAFLHLETIGGFFSHIFVILSPVLAGLCLAFVINELLSPLETLWDWIAKRLRRGKPSGKMGKKVRRPACLTVCYLLVIGIVAAIILIVIPEMERTVGQIGESLPTYAAQIEVWRGKLDALCARHSITLPDLTVDFTELGRKLIGYLTSTENAILTRTLNATTSLISGIINGCLALVFSIYVLAQKETIGWHTDRILYALFPEKVYARITSLAHLTAKTFSNFITGQLLEAVIIGALCFIGMTIFRMPYAAPIAVLVGFTALIPVFGAFIGTGIGAFLILFNNPVKALWFVLFIIVLQQVEGNLIYPKVVGKSVGLPGIWVLFAVTVGGAAFGFIGMLISVPVCSVLYTLCDT